MMWGKTMIRAFFVAVALLAASGAHAQNLQRVPTCGTGNPPAGVSPGTQDTTGRECVTGTITGIVTVAPPGIVGFGTLAATAASTLASTLTLGPNSGAWSATPGLLVVLNDAGSAGNLYVCPIGGTCTAANGLELTPGRSWTFYAPSTSLTVIADSTATAQFQW
jgi:hypothetical protein